MTWAPFLAHEGIICTAKTPRHTLPKTNTQPNAFEFPLQIRSGETMKELIERNRIGALTELELAIDVTEIALRDTPTQPEREHTYAVLQLLKSQRDPQTLQVRVGRSVEVRS